MYVQYILVNGRIMHDDYCRLWY